MLDENVHTNNSTSKTSKSQPYHSLNSSSFRNRKIYPYYFCVVVVADVPFPFPLLNLLQLIYNCFGTGNFTSNKVNKVLICLLAMFRRN